MAGLLHNEAQDNEEGRASNLPPARSTSNNHISYWTRDFNLLYGNSPNPLRNFKLLTVALIIISGQSADMRWTTSRTSASMKPSSAPPAALPLGLPGPCSAQESRHTTQRGTHSTPTQSMQIINPEELVPVHSLNNMQAKSGWRWRPPPHTLQKGKKELLL